jgi:O-succinylbenzoic acid--CoA ligase
MLTLNGLTYNKPKLLALLDSSASREPWEKSLFAFIRFWMDDSQTELAVQTSGSTGVPKQIRLSKEQMIASAEATGKFFGLQKNDAALLCLPTDYIGGKMMVVRAFRLGLNLRAVSPSGNPLWQLNEPFRFAAMTPMQLQTILEQGDEEKLNRIEMLILGGSPVSGLLEEKIKSLRTKVYSTFAMTETVSHFALRKLNGFEKESGADETYAVLPNVFIGQDERGCLVIEGAITKHERLVTNDAVEILDDTHFKWLGRIDNVINSGGIKIFPETLEPKVANALHRTGLADVFTRRFFLASLPEAKLGEKLVLVLEGGALDETHEASIFTALKQGLNRYEVPKAILTIPKFSESPTGKIIRNIPHQK